MVRYITYKVPLDGTNDVALPLPLPMVSVTVYADTTSTTLNVRPQAGSDFIPLNSGTSLNLSEPGRVIDPTTVTLRASVAVTAYVVVGLA